MKHTKAPDSEQPTNNNEHTTDNRADKPTIVTLRIERHRKLYELLKRPKELWRLYVLIFWLLIILIGGLTFLLLIVKAYYPYNTITTGLYGNTTIKSEDTDVTYWLFNTANLWANSGIEVTKGDILTIRASGASHSAIHHLAHDADNNERLASKWKSTEGTKEPITKHREYELSRKFRIAPDEAEGVLLMQVMPKDISDSEKKEHYYDGHETDSRNRIYVIGRERQDLVIKQDGILHFAVNDIVLSDSIIKSMYLDAINEINKCLIRNKQTTIDITKATEIIETTDIGDLHVMSGIPAYTDSVYLAANASTYNFAQYSDSISPELRSNVLVNELLYYKHQNFIDAWFVDNLGSFLIVIERKRPK